MAMPSDQHVCHHEVLVIGNSFAGRRCCSLLKDEPRVKATVIDANHFSEYTPGVLRALVHPAHASALLAETISKAIIGHVERINCPGPSPDGKCSTQQSCIVLTDGRTLRFDTCVVATGSSYAEPIKPAVVSFMPHTAILTAPAGIPRSLGGAETKKCSSRSLLPFLDVCRSTAKADSSTGASQRIHALHSAASGVSEATIIAVVGGGYVGVELAAELAGRYGCSKQIILVSASQTLIPDLPSRASAHCERWLLAHGVQLCLGVRVTSSIPANAGIACGPYSLTLSDGQQLTVDLAFACLGSIPQCPTGLPVSSHGVLVLPTLQVLGMPNVYACGDCADVAGCPKTAFAADLQAELVAKNILRSLTSQPPLQFPQGVCFDKEKVPTICAVSLYKYDGVLVVNWVVVTGLLAAAAKALIERMQVAAARGNAVVRCVWGLMERVSVLIGSKLLY